MDDFEPLLIEPSGELALPAPTQVLIWWLNCCRE